MGEASTPLAIWLTFAGVCFSSILSLAGVIIMFLMNQRASATHAVALVTEQRTENVEHMVDSQKTASDKVIEQNNTLIKLQQQTIDAQQAHLHELGGIIPAPDKGKAP